MSAPHTPRPPRDARTDAESRSARPKGRRGFASMSREKRAAIASKGGRAAHALGRAHQWTPDAAKAAGVKGGRTLAAARGSEYFRALGQKGGAAKAEKRARRTGPATPAEG